MQPGVEKLSGTELTYSRTVAKHDADNTLSHVYFSEIAELSHAMGEYVDTSGI